MRAPIHIRLAFLLLSAIPSVVRSRWAFDVTVSVPSAEKSAADFLKRAVFYDVTVSSFCLMRRAPEC